MLAVEVGEVGEAFGDLGMAGTHGLAPEGQGALEELPRRRVVPGAQAGEGETVEHLGDPGVARAQSFLPHGEGPLPEGPGAVVLALGEGEAGEGVEALGHPRIVRSQGGLADRERALEQRPGLRVAALPFLEAADALEALGDLQALAAEELRPCLQSLAQQGGRPVVEAELLVDGADRLEQTRLHPRLAGQLAVEPPGAQVEDLAGGDVAAAALLGVRDLEQIHQEAGDLLGLVAGLQGALPLPPQVEGVFDPAQEEDPARAAARGAGAAGPACRGSRRAARRPRRRWAAPPEPGP